MQEPSLITEYLDALSREFGFDTALGHRVRSEVEDHLRESTPNQPGMDPVEAQRRAIAEFGDAREIARQYAASSLFAQTRRVGGIALLALIVVYAGMKGRGAWYALMQWGLSDHLKEVVPTWISIDLNAFRIALAVGIIGLGYIGTRRAPTSFHQACRRQVTCCVVLSAITACALVASVVTDTIITGLRLLEAKLTASALVPLLSIAAEITLVSALGLCIYTTIRRTAFASSLLKS
jgi:hypothetical protein